MSDIELDESIADEIRTEKSFYQETDTDFKKNSLKSSRRHSKTI